MSSAPLVPPTDSSQVPNGVAQSLPRTEALSICEEWIQKAQKYFDENDVDGFLSSFARDSYWKDHLLLDLDFNSLQVHEIKDYLATIAKSPAFIKDNRAGLPQIYNLTVDRPWETKHVVAGAVDWCQSLLTFETKNARGNGVLRLKREGAIWKAWIFSTQLWEVKGHEDFAGSRRLLGTEHGENINKKSWLDKREEAIAFEDKDPVALIIGGGQNGLMIAARLTALGIPNLVVDQNNRVGDSWRRRYRTLVLHDRIFGNHYPFMPYPPTWPTFIPKDKMANWMEGYAETMELNIWLNTTVTPGAQYNPSTGSWTIEVVRGASPTRPDSGYPDGHKLGPTRRTMHPKYLIVSTGFSGEPRIPTFPMSDFKGICVHSSKHEGAVGGQNNKWRGKRAVVIGCCNSGHDIAADFYEQGAESTTIVQRSSTYVMSSEHGLPALLDGYYQEGGPTPEDGDLLFTSFPLNVLNEFHIEATKKIAKKDEKILEGLKKAGFKINPYPGGLFMKYFRDGGGYYIDVGCSGLIADGKVKIKQGKEVTRLTPSGVLFEDGQEIPADVVVLATGYSSQRDTIRRLIGPHVSEKLGPVWGCDRQGEIPGAWRFTGQPGLLLQVGNFFQARAYSKHVALTILLQEVGLADKNFAGRLQKADPDPRF